MSDAPATFLCGSCWEATADLSRCERCEASPLLDGTTGRYRLDAKLGQGASGTTFRATRLPDNRIVCVNALAYQGMSSFDAEQAFHREATILRQLHHPQIPAYIDDFSAGSGRTFALYLVQELVEGLDLEADARVRRPTLKQALALLDDILSVVEHLHDLVPPVLHRDLKPRNIMRRTRDGRVVLVDFGAVKSVVQASFDPGLSLVGTVGYMAPEQLRGQSSVTSDLYAVGMVGVALLSGREPATMLDDTHEAVWRRHVSVPAPIADWLASMTAATPSQRPATATEARRRLSAAIAAGEAPVAAPIARRRAVVSAERAVTRAPTGTPSAAATRIGVAGCVVAAVASFFQLVNIHLPIVGVLNAAAHLAMAIGWLYLARTSRGGVTRALGISQGILGASALLWLLPSATFFMYLVLTAEVAALLLAAVVLHQAVHRQPEAVRAPTRAGSICSLLGGLGMALGTLMILTGSYTSIVFQVTSLFLSVAYVCAIPTMRGMRRDAAG